MVEYPIPQKLWEHPNPKATSLWNFVQHVNRKRDLALSSFEDLHEWSVGPDRLSFWNDVWETSRLIYSGDYTWPVDPHVRMDNIPKWFYGTQLNFAENLLFSADRDDVSRRSTWEKPDHKVAVTEVREGCNEIRHVTWGELRSRVGLLSNAMRNQGLKKGDRVAVVASNSVDTLCVFLATAALGGLFSSSSTDMGTKGILDRLLQIKPKWVFVDDVAVYNGRTTDLRPKMREIVDGVKNLRGFEGLVAQQRFVEPRSLDGVPFATPMSRFMSRANGETQLRFERIEFRDPFLVVYSSGTTGVPKCIVHSVGGVLVNAMKEGRIQRGLDADTVGLQYTTTGWIMYLSAIMFLLHGGRAILYDGSPFKPDLETFVRLVGREKVTSLGISPRYLQELQNNNVIPKKVADLSRLEKVTSTGMVLSDALFQWVYDVFPRHIHLSNISGGTDLAGCFAMENPLTPLYVGGCQGPSLGVKVEVYDQTVEGGKDVQGRSLPDGEPGELVATASFPNQPVYFMGDQTGERYFNAYYSRFDNVWTHGDFIMKHPVTKQILFMGRADGVLNPSGVRFGSAEIYSVIEQFFSSEVQDSVCVGQRRPSDTDESVMLFLLMKPGKKFSQELVKRIKERIAKECSKRHVPRYVFETPEIPTTINLKKVELPVKQIVSGQTIKPSDTLANKQCLDFYYQFAKVEELATPKSKL